MIERKLDVDANTIIAQVTKDMAKIEGQKGPLISEETFKHISEMSYKELEELIKDIDNRYPGFRNLIGKKGTGAFRFHAGDYVPSPKERTPKSVLFDDSKDICEEYKNGKKIL